MRIQLGNFSSFKEILNLEKILKEFHKIKEMKNAKNNQS